MVVTFKFNNYGTDLGTRDMGQRIRSELLPIINGNEKVILDFSDVNVVSNAFADECIAKLLLEFYHFHYLLIGGLRADVSYLSEDSVKRLFRRSITL